MNARLAVNIEDAAALLSISRESFDKYVRHEVRFVRQGRLKLVPVKELEAWLDRNASRALEN